MLTGGCFCGAVRYETDGIPFHEVSCHCSMCRRTMGAPYVAWFSVPKASLRWLKQQPQIFHSSTKATRSFCNICGTQLAFENIELPNEIDITIGSLDDANLLSPKKDIHLESKLAWVHVETKKN